MKTLLLATIMFFSTQYYELHGVKRIDKDLYAVSDGWNTLYIQTEWCYHYTRGETAILKWNGVYSYDNEIIWEDGTKCNVKKMFLGN